MSNTHPIKNIQPDIKSGMVYISMFILAVDYLKSTSKPALNRHFERIFKDQAPHLSNKFTFHDLAGFFLNLDIQHQVAFMSDAGFDNKLLVMPPIENWEKYGNMVGMNEADEPFTQEDVRMIGGMFLNDWDIYSHAVVWVRKFLMYANNNPISDKDYKGSKFGIYPNWAEYYTYSSIEKKQEFLQSLINY